MGLEKGEEELEHQSERMRKKLQILNELADKPDLLKEYMEITNDQNQLYRDITSWSNLAVSLRITIREIQFSVIKWMITCGVIQLLNVSFYTNLGEGHKLVMMLLCTTSILACFFFSAVEVILIVRKANKLKVFKNE
jgi:hypothetical protein